MDILPSIGETFLGIGVILLFVWSIADGYHDVRFEEFKQQLNHAAGDSEAVDRVISQFYRDSRIDLSLELISVGSMFGTLFTMLGLVLVLVQ